MSLSSIIVQGTMLFVATVIVMIPVLDLVSRYKREKLIAPVPRGDRAQEGSR